MFPPVQHIHPMLVHFPIVLVYLLAGFELVASLMGRSVTGRTTPGNVATALAVLAGLSAIAALYFGGVALDFAEAGGFHSDIAEIHESLGEKAAIGLGIWAVIRAALWWFKVEVKPPFGFVFPVVAIAAALLVTFTAYYGGQLVFDLGVNVTKAAVSG